MSALPSPQQEVDLLKILAYHLTAEEPSQLQR